MPQATTIERELNAHGYASIGLDHFALEHDELTKAARSGTMRRNFQGYTTDVSDALLAFGASAIGEFRQGFYQSARDTLEWSQRIDRNESPVTRGLATTAEDRMRSEVIERLMCDLSVDAAAIARRHGFDPVDLRRCRGKTRTRHLRPASPPSRAPASACAPEAPPLPAHRGCGLRHAFRVGTQQARQGGLTLILSLHHARARPGHPLCPAHEAGSRRHET